MHPLSRAAIPLDAAVTNTSVLSGQLALPRQTSQPRQLESATASPDLLLTQSSQNLGSQPEHTNQDSQVSDSSQIDRMMLKYSDDEVTDEEMRELNLQTTAHQYMMKSDAQHQTTPISFQKPPSTSRAMSPSKHYIPDGQNTQLRQIVHQQPAQLPDGSQGIRLQILYLEAFFDTTWCLIHDDT